MEDSCSPPKKTLYSHRIYSVLFPILLLILFIEFFFVMMYYPDSLGSMLSVKGSLPKVPGSILQK